MERDATGYDYAIAAKKLRQRIFYHLEKTPGIDLFELQLILGYARKDFGNIPNTNPVNRELKKLELMGDVIEINETTSKFGCFRIYFKIKGVI